MKRFTLTAIWAICLVAPCLGQGWLDFSNQSARTRLGSLNGPFAGASILGQLFVGSTPESLVPIASPASHMNGYVVTTSSNRHLSVPGIFAGEIAYVQMVAWDSRSWGTTLTGVPANQFGKTDIVPVHLTTELFPHPRPAFTEPAVVPPIPEPAVGVLVVAGLAAMYYARHRGLAGKRASVLSSVDPNGSHL